jgi:TRAP-type C4-dicarboxylate transport system permease small subunit
MLITRKSRRRSQIFRSRFAEGNAAFPLRQYFRCREELVSSIVHAVILLAFLITLLYFSRTIWQVFAAHGTDLSPWYRRLAMFAMVLVELIVVYRLWRKVRNIFHLRQEMNQLKSDLSSPDEPTK